MEGTGQVVAFILLAFVLMGLLPMLNVHSQMNLYRDLEWNFQDTVNDIATKKTELQALKDTVRESLCDGNDAPFTNCSTAEEALTRAAAVLNFKHQETHDDVVDLEQERDDVSDLLPDAVQGDDVESPPVDVLVNNAIQLIADGTVARSRKRWVHEVTKHHAEMRGCDPLSNVYVDSDGATVDLLTTEAETEAFLGKNNSDIIRDYQVAMLDCENTLLRRRPNAIDVSFDSRSFRRPNVGLC